MAIKTIFNPLLEEGFQKLNDSAGTNPIFLQTGRTTNNVQLSLSGSKTITVQSVQSFITRVTAIQSVNTGAGTVGDVWVHEFRGAVKKIDPAGSALIVDSVTDEYIAEDAAMTGVSGETGKTIEWKAETIFSEIIYV